MLTPKNAAKLVTEQDLAVELMEVLDGIFDNETQAFNFVQHVLERVRVNLLKMNAISIECFGTLQLIKGPKTRRKIPGGSHWEGEIRPRMKVILRDKFIEDFKSMGN